MSIIVCVYTCENPALVLHEMRQFVQRVQGGEGLARLRDEQRAGVFVDVLCFICISVVSVVSQYNCVYYCDT
jgi:hypothetical protein